MSNSNLLNLRVGEWVEVRSAEEILATLDAEQTVDRLPFMPEMLQHCGKRFRVFKSAHKTADTSEFYTIRGMKDAVHLENLRCDGSAHGGCQARCLFFWKETWLKRVSDHSNGETGKGTTIGKQENGARPGKLDALTQATRYPGLNGEPERFRCQATEMLRATTDVRRRQRWSPRFYVRDLTSGNVKWFDFLRFGIFAMFNAFLLRWFDFRLPRVRGLAGEKTPTQNLNLQPGECVRVRPLREIETTLSSKLRNRGMWFDVEMVQYCGKGPYRVLSRVDRIINEKTGEMTNLPNPCIILDDVTCSGNYLYQRMFSPRNEYPYWREIWLERVSETDSGRFASGNPV
jgi:hypothetical protein